jgi:hypothetical protein
MVPSGVTDPSMVGEDAGLEPRDLDDELES